MLYLFIVVSFNQEYQYHTSIPVSIYAFVGYLIFYDMYMYTLGCYLAMVVWKQCLRQGVVCSCNKKNNLVAHFIGSIHRVCVCGYYNVFLLLIVGSILFIAAGYVAYPKWFKSHTLICVKTSLRLYHLWFFFIYC